MAAISAPSATASSPATPRTLGFIFQQFNLIPTLTALENVEVALAPTSSRRPRAARPEGFWSGLSWARAPTISLPALRWRAATGGHRPGPGQQPEVLLADEPTGNLDTKTGDAILALLYSLWEETGLTVILITHDPAIAGTAPRVLRLADGHVVAEEIPSTDITPDLASASER